MKTLRKLILFLVLALVAGLTFTACEKECNDFHIDYGKEDIVGTWTCLKADFANALQINADGSVVSTAVEGGRVFIEKKGSVEVDEDKMHLVVDAGMDAELQIQVVAGEMMVITDERGESFVYKYCKKNLSEAIRGLWVYMNTDSNVDETKKTGTQSFRDNGKTIYTGFSPDHNEFLINSECDYKLIGDLLVIMDMNNIDSNSNPLCHCSLVSYQPNATGDILHFKFFEKSGDARVEKSVSCLRVKETLELSDKKYGYSGAYITNVKGLDRDIDFMGHTINFSKVNGVSMDKLLSGILFGVEFPDDNTFRYSHISEQKRIYMDAPIVVDGNKMIVKMSEKSPVYRDVELYVFQSAHNQQLHMYMPRTSYVNFFANMQVTMMSQMGSIDLADAEAVAEVYKTIDDAVESINVSFVMKRKLVGE